MENQELIKQVTEKAEKWLTPAYDAETQAEVKRMLENDDKTELIEAFYKDLEFGTGGLRGIMESILMPIMYAVPSDKSISCVRITEACVSGGEPPFVEYKNNKKVKVEA